MKAYLFLIKVSLLILFTAIAVVLVFRHPPMAQSLAYHHFADARMFFYIPNFWNVVSNVAFLIPGILGLWFLLKKTDDRDMRFMHASEKVPYIVFFFGAALVAFGSGYYHWYPDNATLVWDRLPMTIAFMSLLAALVAERINLKAGLFLLLPLLILGVFSVFYWSYTESLGRGDLRLYWLVQFYPLVVILLMLGLFKARYTAVRYLLIGFLWYFMAKVFEMADVPVYKATHHIISGHTLKHLAAAIAIFYIYLYLRRRQKCDA